MMRHLPMHLAWLISGFMLISCSQMQQSQKQDTAPQEPPQEAPPPLYLGSVHQVFSADKFALLRIIGPIPAEGTVLITHPADGSTERVGNLIVASAQHARNSIIAADIRAGVVMKGDRVFQYRSITDTLEEEEPEPISLTGVDIDVGYTPPHIKEKLQQQPSPESAEITSYTPEPARQADAQPEEMPADTPPSPVLPTPQENGKFDDIPDTISGWDSM